MITSLITPAAVARPLIVTIVLIVVAIILSGILGGLAIVGLVTWAILIGGIVVGAYLAVRAGRPIAGAGAFAMALSTWLAFFIQSPAFVWTGLFFIGGLLIAKGTAADTSAKNAWPICMLRIMFGWAWVDNAQDHFLNNWLPGGGGFLQGATASASRAPLNPLDAAYQAFLKGVVVPGGEQFAALTICGELSFGLLLAMGFLTPVAAIGLLWHSTNYILQRGFTPHGGYTDKVFFTADLFCLVTMAGLAYGLDAALRRHVPSTVAETFMATVGQDSGAAPSRGRAPQPA